MAIVATGHYNEPIMPRWPGHRGLRRAPPAFARLSLGAGVRRAPGRWSSGSETAGRRSRPTWSSRAPPPLRSRCGLPRRSCRAISSASSPFSSSALPSCLCVRPGSSTVVGAVMRRIGTGDLSSYGLGKAAWGPFTARRPAVIDVGFLAQLKRRRITVRPARDSTHRARRRCLPTGATRTFDVRHRRNRLHNGPRRDPRRPGRCRRRRPARLPFGTGDSPSRSLFHRVRRNRPRPSLRGESRIEAARGGGRAVSQVLTRKVQRLKRTKATGVIRSKRDRQPDPRIDSYPFDERSKDRDVEDCRRARRRPCSAGRHPRSLRARVGT